MVDVQVRGERFLEASESRVLFSEIRIQELVEQCVPEINFPIPAQVGGKRTVRDGVDLPENCLLLLFETLFHLHRRGSALFDVPSSS